MGETATTSSSVSQDPVAQLRTGRFSAQQRRLGRGVKGPMKGVGTLQSSLISRDDAASSRRDPVRELRAGRQVVKRYNNFEESMPEIAAMQENLSTGNAEEQGDAEGFAEEMAEAADENQAAQTQEQAIRARSRIRGIKAKVAQKKGEKDTREVQELVSGSATQVTALALSGGDQGEGLEIADAAGVAISATRVIVTILPPSDDGMKALLGKVGLSSIKMGQFIPLGEITVAGFAMQVIGMGAKITGIIFLVVFTFLAFGTVTFQFGWIAKTALQLLLP